MLKLNDNDPFYAKRHLALQIIDNLDAMVAYLDANEFCLFANTAYQVWFSKAGKTLIGLSLKDLLGQAYVQNLAYLQRAYAGEKQVFEHAMAGPDGVVKNSLVTYIPHLIRGEIDGVFVHIADIEPLKIRMEELRAAKTTAERAATHDYLTGLPNRLLLSQTLLAALSQASRRQEGFVVVTIDLDRFKQINDGFGHAEGDLYLVEMARRMSGAMRESDAIFRTGGDEFLAIASQINSVSHAEVFARKLVESVRQKYWIGDTILLPSLSAGVAFYPETALTCEELLKASDDALYAAKGAGRNRYALSSSDGDKEMPFTSPGAFDPLASGDAAKAMTLVLRESSAQDFDLPLS